MIKRLLSGEKFKFILTGMFILLGAILLTIMSVSMISNDCCILEDDCIFISTADIEEAYGETGIYVEYMIADYNTEYIFGTIEEYVCTLIESNEKCVVSGVFYSKNTDKTVYEVAIINMKDKSDIQYLLVDPETCKLYNHEIHEPVIEDTNMIEELDKIENEYIDLQNEYMENHEQSKIITEDYMIDLVKQTMKCSKCKCLETIKDEETIFYKVDVEYNSGDSDIILVNARTGYMYK